MKEANKLKALGYKEENIDEKCTLFFKSNKVLFVRDRKDITELNLGNASYNSNKQMFQNENHKNKKQCDVKHR